MPLIPVGIRFLSPNEGIDTSAESPMSRFLLLHLFAAFAEMEREIIRERVRAGVRAAKAKGIALELASLPSLLPGRPLTAASLFVKSCRRAKSVGWRPF